MFKMAISRCCKSANPNNDSSQLFRSSYRVLSEKNLNKSYGAYLQLIFGDIDMSCSKQKQRVYHHVKQFELPDIRDPFIHEWKKLKGTSWLNACDILSGRLNSELTNTAS